MSPKPSNYSFVINNDVRKSSIPHDQSPTKSPAKSQSDEPDVPEIASMSRARSNIAHSSQFPLGSGNATKMLKFYLSTSSAGRTKERLHAWQVGARDANLIRGRK